VKNCNTFAQVRSIKKAQLDELRVMVSPPAAVKMSLEAICTLLYAPPRLPPLQFCNIVRAFPAAIL